MTGKSALFTFMDLEISLLQRMAGKRAATAASRQWVGCRLWAGLDGTSGRVIPECCAASDGREEPNRSDAAPFTKVCYPASEDIA